jgi:3D (Asp-Asp-Asp) domain-containing protein
MKNKKQLVYAGIITSMIISDAILGNSYIKDIRNYESKLSSQSKIIKQQEINIHKQREQITNQLGEVKELTLQNNELQIELNNANKEIEQLKKQLANKKEVRKQRKLNMTLTFYGADCEGCSGITKTGLDVSNTIYYKGYHVIAADPRVISLHSIIKIETKNGTFYGYVADTGSAIKNNILDVLVSSEKQSYKYGRQQAVVTVLREGKGVN